MKLNFKKPIIGAALAVSLVAPLSASELKFSVEITDGANAKVYQTTGYLVGANGVSVVGLPNDITVKELKVIDGKAMSKVQVLSYDAYGRYAFVRVPAKISEGKALTKISSQSSTITSAQSFDGAEKFIVAGIVGRHDGKVLPFSFLRLHHKDYQLDARKFPFVKSVDGSLVGMLHSAVPKTSYAFYAIPGDVFMKTASDIKDFGAPTRAWVGVILDAAVDLPVVKSVRPASPAAKAGFQKGDIITQIGEKKIANYSDAVKAFYLLKAEQETHFKLVRVEQHKELTFTPQKFPSVGGAK